MDIGYLHLYVRDAEAWHTWFVNALGFRSADSPFIQQRAECAVQSAQILILLSSGKAADSKVQAFLRQYSEGVADLAFWVDDLTSIVSRLHSAGIPFTTPVTLYRGCDTTFRWCCIQGWKGLSHTLVERSGRASVIGSSPVELPHEALLMPEFRSTSNQKSVVLPWLRIDHAVLNVPQGDLLSAANWYETHLGFVPQQQFSIATPQSGLRSLVLKHPQGTATLPINEPTSENSQIQEFLDIHGGAGIQHVALQTQNLVETVAILRQRGIPFLPVPTAYYRQIQQRPGYWQAAGDWQAIADQQLLVDWPPEDPQLRLLQTFSQPLFEKPTFFWELIERQVRLTKSGVQQAEGFGAGNFQALFEAIEREQQQRGTL